MKKALFTALFGIAITACGSHAQQICITEPIHRPACFTPTAPDYRQLDPAEHIASPANIEALLLNISDMAAYSARLEAALECHRMSNEAGAND